ncbi:MAG: hypothetical protein ACYC0E_00180 [Acidimicrobiales bacterium]
MSDVSQGPGWWLASDGRWYPPETHPQYRAAATTVAEPGAATGSDPAAGSATPATGSDPAAMATTATDAATTAPGEPAAGTAPAGAADEQPGWATTHVTACHHRVVGPGLVVLGLAIVVWGVGAIFNAMAAVHAGFPRDEQVGGWLTAAGILAVGLVTALIGLRYRRG